MRKGAKMEEKLLKIFNTWDASKQLKQLHSEVFELTEAIFENGDKSHICEEIADCYVLLEQFRLFFQALEIFRTITQLCHLSPVLPKSDPYH